LIVVGQKVGQPIGAIYYARDSPRKWIVVGAHKSVHFFSLTKAKGSSREMEIQLKLEYSNLKIHTDFVKGIIAVGNNIYTVGYWDMSCQSAFKHV
jgi:hypothetical protein